MKLQKFFLRSLTQNVLEFKGARLFVYIYGETNS